LNSIVDTVPSAWVLLSVDYGGGSGLPLPLTKKALEFMSGDDTKRRTLEEAVPLSIQHCQLQIWRSSGIYWGSNKRSTLKHHLERTKSL
jgi:hypothetical protein